MGSVALAAKITHVPSMYISELPGKHHGTRDAAIAGHKAIGDRARALGVDTVVVFDTHWLVNNGYHVNCYERFEGIYSSPELPHFIKDMPYAHRGDPELGRAIAAAANDLGVRTRAHEIQSLTLEYGTLMPMRYMSPQDDFAVVSISAFCTSHEHEDSRLIGQAVRQAIEASGRKAMVLASGSLSHRFMDNRAGESQLFDISREFYRQVDLKVLELWRKGDFKTFTAMLPEYATLCRGEGMMHDTVMLLGLLGWDAYDRPVEIVTDYFGSSGTGQVNAIFPV